MPLTVKKITIFGPIWYTTILMSLSITIEVSSLKRGGRSCMLSIVKIQSKFQLGAVYRLCYPKMGGEGFSLVLGHAHRLGHRGTIGSNIIQISIT